MKKIITFLFLTLLLAGCANPSKSRLAKEPIVTNPPKKRIWVADIGTNLYKSPDFDSEVLVFFDKGDEITTLDGKNTLECKTIRDDGISIHLCEAYAPKYDLTGWVLFKWYTEKK